MSLADAISVRSEGNLTDSVHEDKINPFITIAQRQLQGWLGLDVYQAIVARDDTTFTTYSSDFSTGVNGWAQNAGDADLVVSGNNDSILGRDNVLKVIANDTNLQMRLVNAGQVPAGGKAYKLQFDYYAEEDCGVPYLGMEVSATERGRDPYGDFLAVSVVEETWQIAKVMRFLGAGALYLTGYSSPAGPNQDDTIATLANGKAIYFSSMRLEYLNDKAILTIAESQWALGLALPSLAIHSAGDGLALMGGAAEGRYQYVGHAEAARMGKRYIARAKDMAAMFHPAVLDSAGHDQALIGGGVTMLAV